MANDNASIWDRLPRNTPPKKKPATKAAPTASTVAVSRPFKRRLAIASAIAAILWGYVGLKLFVLDVDAFILGVVLPDTSGALAYRPAVILVLLMVVVYLSRRLWKWLLYVAVFPLALVVIGFPLLLHKLGIWQPTIALSSFMYGLHRNLRATIICRLAEVASVIALVAEPPPPVAILSILVLVACLLRTYARTLFRAFTPGRFLLAQAAVADRMLSKSQYMVVPEKVRRSKAQRLSAKQAELFLNNLSFGLAAIKGASFFAFQLDRYRRSTLPVTLCITSYVSLFLYSFIVLAAINYAIYIIDPSQFVTRNSLGLLTFAEYTMTLLLGGGSELVSATGAIAITVKIVTNFLGPVFILTLIVNGVQTIRVAREGSDAGEAIRKILDAAKRASNRVRDEFNVTPDEALQRLIEFGIANVAAIVWLVTRTPQDFQVKADPE